MHLINLNIYFDNYRGSMMNAVEAAVNKSNELTSRLQ